MKLLKNSYEALKTTWKFLSRGYALCESSAEVLITAWTSPKSWTTYTKCTCTMVHSETQTIWNTVFSFHGLVNGTAYPVAAKIRSMYLDTCNGIEQHQENAHTDIMKQKPHAYAGDPYITLNSLLSKGTRPYIASNPVALSEKQPLLTIAAWVITHS